MSNDLVQMYGPGYAGILNARNRAAAMEGQALRGIGMLSDMQSVGLQQQMMQQKMAEQQRAVQAAQQRSEQIAGMLNQPDEAVTGMLGMPANQARTLFQLGGPDALATVLKKNAEMPSDLRMINALPEGPQRTAALQAKTGIAPDLRTVDSGGSTSFVSYDPVTRQPTVVGQMGKTAAPGAIPFEMSDLTPQQARDHSMSRSRAQAPVTQVTVNTERNLFGDMAGAVGKDIAAGAANARAAVNTINTVNQIRSALDSGKMMAGPATTAIQFLGQIGQVMGIAGENATQRLVETRRAIQGLAQLELDAAQQMKGQGQITEAEREIIRRAASGDIDGMTIPELRTLTDVMDKAARFKIASNQRNVDVLRQSPGAGSLPQFMEVPMPPAYTGPERRSAPRAGSGRVVVDY